MLILYSPTPALISPDYRERKMPDTQFAELKFKAIQLMRHRMCKEDEIRHLQDTPYELWVFTKAFHRPQYKLITRASMAKYAEMERELESGSYLQQNTFPHIVKAFETLDVELNVMGMVLETDNEVRPVAAPQLKVTSETVEAALRDAETLIGTSGAPNALDRAHTAFHGYLQEVCDDANITVATDADITTLFSQLRDKHRKLKIVDPQADKMTVEIMRGFARVIDSLNPARNTKSLAHPNTLLDPPEAMLAINAIRTMLHYLDNRLK